MKQYIYYFIILLPSMGNSARIVNASGRPPFERVSVRRRELTKEELSERVENLSQKATRFLKCIVDEGDKVIKPFVKDPDQRDDSVKCLICFSIRSTIAHMIIQGGIMSKYVDDEIFGLMTAFLCAICAFTLFNFCLISPCSSFLGKPSCLVKELESRLTPYFILLCVYLGLFYNVADFLRKNDSGHFIASLVVFFLSVNVHGMAVFLIGIVYLIYGILYCCCKFILYLTLNFCCNSKEVETNPTIYLYDPSKTEEKTCTICYQEYEKLDQIRVCKIHLAHIFHEKCISDWLLRNPSCPLCGGNQRAIFH